MNLSGSVLKNRPTATAINETKKLIDVNVLIERVLY
jgi:hypothetical protein